MLTRLLVPLRDSVSFFNIFRYITVRTALAGITAMLLSFLLGPVLIRILRRADGDLLKLFSYVISLPYYSYRHTGMPVVVMIDDFHKIRKLSELIERGYDKDLWMLFENPISFRFSPHIIAGFNAELHKMFFEETSFGEHLEIINLGGLKRHDSSGLFRSLCDRYALSCEADMSVFLDLFGGNPFYVKSFVQAARQTSRSLSHDDLSETYIR